MLQGMGAVALLWMAWACFVLRPAGIEVSLGATALLAAAFVAVLQALLWSPFGLPWVRVVLAVVLLPLLALAPQLGPALGVKESVLVGLYAALIPLAGATAYAGVSRARHGQAADWRGLFRVLRTADRWPSRRQAPFASPARAQSWFERRRHLIPFPLAVGALAGLWLALLLWADVHVQQLDSRFFWGLPLLFSPPILAPFFGCFLGRTGTSAGNPYLLSSFTATRPVQGTALVAAKLKVAVLATLAAWAIVLLAASVWLASYESFWNLWNDLRQAYPFWRVAAITLLAAGGPVFLTWRLLVDNLWIGLTGRAWIVRGSLLACGLGLTSAGLLAQLLSDPGLRDRLWVALPWWAGGAAFLKLLAAACVGRALLRRGLIRPQTLAKLLALWLLAAAGVFVLACAAIPPGSAPVSLLAFGAVLCVPMARLAAAPLALAWNRHR